MEGSEIPHQYEYCAAALKSFQLLRIVVMLPLGISDEVIEACLYPFFCIL